MSRCLVKSMEFDLRGVIHFCRSNVVGLRLLKAIISGTTSRHMIDHHVGTRGTRQRSFVLMYAIHRLYLSIYLGQVYLVKSKTPLPSLLTTTTIYLASYLGLPYRQDFITEQGEVGREADAQSRSRA